MKYDSYQASGIEWLGDIPSHWHIEKVKWIFRHVTQMAEKNNNYELLSVYTDIGVKPRRELEARGNKATTTDSYWLVKKGDIVVNKLLAWMGAVGLSNYDGVTSPAYDVLRAVKDIDVRYYNYIFRSSQTLSEFKKRSKGIMEMRLRLYFDELGQILFPLPPKEEQKAIADFLDKKLESINSYISKQKNLIELLKEKKSSLINQAVTKGIDNSVEYVDSGIEWLGKIPKHWEVKKLKFISKILNGATPSSTNTNFWNGDIIWVTPEDISKNIFLNSSFRKITKVGYKSCGTNLVPRNSLIITTRAPIGNISITKNNLCTNQGCKSVVINIGEFMFYYYVLLSNNKILNSLGSGTTFLELATSSLKNFIVQFPPIFEQKEIANYIEKESKKIDDVISNIEDELKLLDEYKQSIISSAVTGKIKVF